MVQLVNRHGLPGQSANSPRSRRGVANIKDACHVTSERSTTAAPLKGLVNGQVTRTVKSAVELKWYRSVIPAMKSHMVLLLTISDALVQILRKSSGRSRTPSFWKSHRRCSSLCPFRIFDDLKAWGPDHSVVGEVLQYFYLEECFEIEASLVELRVIGMWDDLDPLEEALYQARRELHPVISVFRQAPRRYLSACGN